MGQEEVYQLVLNAFFLWTWPNLEIFTFKFFCACIFLKLLKCIMRLLYIMVMVHHQIMVKKYSVAPDAKSVSENQEYQVKMASKYKRDSIA